MHLCYQMTDSFLYCPLLFRRDNKLEYEDTSDVVCQTRKFYAQTNMLLRNFRYCTNDVKCTLFKSFCANMYCCPFWFNSTSSTIKKLKTSYNSALRNLLLIKKPYSASTMFITHGIPSFYELLRTSIYRRSQKFYLNIYTYTKLSKKF